MSLLNTLKSRVGVAVLTLSSAGALGIMAHEGLKLASYRDPIGIVTVCAGHTATAKLGQVKTPEQCAELLKSDVKYAEAAVKRLVTVKITQKQFDSLVSFTFNVGEGNLSSSTLLKKVNANDCYGAGAEFLKWNKADGRVLPGLTKRRADERAQWETGCALIKTAQATPHKAGNAGGWSQTRRPEYHPATSLAFSA